MKSLMIHSRRAALAAAVLVGLAAAGADATASPLGDNRGDINGDGSISVVDINCFIASALAEASSMPAPACLAGPVELVDLQCDGGITVLDVQREILIRLFELSQDAEIKSLLMVADANFNGLHDNCEKDQDGDGLLDPVDNCPADPNPDQEDMDGDGLGDACDTNQCTDVVCPDDGNPCTDEVCDAKTGACGAPVGDGTPCDADGDGCTVSDACLSGVCVAGQEPDCSEVADACTAGVCVSAGPDAYDCAPDVVALDGAPCDDGQGCTTDDACDAGQCVGTAVVCADDGDPCTVDVCAPETGACGVPATDGTVCDADGSGCTIGDACVAGLCVAGAAPDCSGAGDACSLGVCASSGPDSYTCEKDAAAKNSAPCDDGAACTTGDVCAEGLCVGAAVVCPDDGDPCTDDVCVAETGACGAPAVDGTPCDADADGCTVGDSCAAGVCEAGAAADCAGVSDPCNEGVCVSNGSAAYQCVKDPTPKEGLACDDGQDCTDPDTCTAGACVGSSVQCPDDGDPCTVVTCLAGSGECGTVPAPDGTACNADGDGCTVGDSCKAGVCEAGASPDCSGVADACNAASCESLGAASYKCAKDPGPKDGIGCSDGKGCTVGDLCSGGTCQAGPAPDCSSVADACNAGACSATGPDAFVCVKDPAPLEEAPCDDGQACTTGDDCHAGACVGTAVVCADDGNPCTIDVCVPETGACGVSAGDGVPCSDGDGCTLADACQGGACQPGTAPDCSGVEDPCNASVCAATGPDAYECAKDPTPKEGAPCTDGDGCTVGDACQAGSCAPGAAPDCSAESDACNAGACASTDPDTFTCVKDPAPMVGAPCDDGLACTESDACAAGVCEGAPVQCADDSDPCTDPTCDPGTGACVTVPAVPGTPCSDGDGCTLSDTCVAGLCEPGAAPDCSGVSDTCNVGACQATGPSSFLCVKDPGPKASAPCSDGNGCTVGDACGDGACVSGAAPDCSSVADACNGGVCSATGPATYQCVKDPAAKAGDPCDDGSLCTDADGCVAGTCTGVPVTCGDDGDGCTDDVCDPTTGSCGVVKADGAPCDDGEACTSPDTCTTGACGGPTLPACADPGAGLVCLLSGTAGSEVTCELHLARTAEADPPAVGIQFGMTYDGAKAELLYFEDGEFCPIPNTCFPWKIPGTSTALQSGHSVSFEPKTLSAWEGLGYLFLINTSAPVPLTDAWLDGPVVQGDSLLVTARFKLLANVPAEAPVQVSLSTFSASDSNTGPVSVEVLYLLMRTTPQ